MTRMHASKFRRWAAWLLVLAWMASPALAQLRAAEPGSSGVRFLADGSILSVSARAAAGGLVVTVMGQDAAPEFLRWLENVDPAAYDSSGLVEGVAVVRSPAGGLPMLEIDVRTREPVEFSVSNEGSAVEVRLAPDAASGATEKAAADDELEDAEGGSPRRVLTVADLETLEVEPVGSEALSQGVRARTIGRVNLRPEPDLASEPLMTLPDRTVVRVVERGDEWWLVRLGELEGWLRGNLLQPAAVETAPDPVPQTAEDWLGERGAWLDRLDQALGATEVPEWDEGDLRSGGEVALQNRAEREASRRRLAVAEQDLREARAESASLRIDLARAGQEMDEARTRMEMAEARAAELEAMVEALRRDAVASRSGIEGERLRVFESERRAEVAEREQGRLRARVEVLEDELVTARVAVEMARVEADGLRLAARDALLGAVDVGESRERPTVVVEPSGLDAPRSGGLPRTGAAAGAALVLWTGVETALDGWATAWSNRDPDAYLSFYADSFFIGRDEDTWRDLRRRRVEEPEWIDVTLDELELTLAAAPDEDDPIRVRTSFEQTYRSSSYQDVVRKELDWAWIDGSWKIVDERSVAVLLVGSG